MTDQAVRDELLRRASRDEITADEAESEARRLGLEPFATQPDPTKFDPMAESQWTLAMAIAWISMRTVGAVRMAWNAYRSHYWYWKHSDFHDGPGGPLRSGWLLENLGPATSLGLEILDLAEDAEARGESVVMSVKDAREALWVALGEGMLTATGLTRLGGGRVPIAADEWLALLPLYSDHRDEVGRDGVGLDYAEPLVPSKAVRHLWGPRRERVPLPPLMVPGGDGYMPLGCAAQWIATEGGSIDFDPYDQQVWQRAFDQLLGAIASEKVRASGLGSRSRELVPGHLFAGIIVDPPFAEITIDMILSEVMYLRCYPYVDEPHWRDGFDDALVSRHGNHWTQLMVEKGDVRRLWPFDEQAAPTRSGAPGRPTSMHLVLEELERHAAAGEMSDGIVAESRYLSQWLATEHADKPQAKPKAIEASIRSRYYELRGRK